MIHCMARCMLALHNDRRRRAHGHAGHGVLPSSKLFRIALQRSKYSTRVAGLGLVVSQPPCFDRCLPRPLTW